MSQVLSLFNYEKESSEEIPRCVVFSDYESMSLYRLSPEVMRIDEGLYIADLKKTTSYWQKQAMYQERDIKELLVETVLKEVNGSEAPLAVFCEHPFQGLVFFQALKSKQASGSFFMDSIFSQKSYSNISWHFWLEAAEILNFCFEEKGFLKKERKNFSSHKARFQRFLNRLRLTKMTDLKEAEFFEVQRRFHAFLGLLWKWTFPDQFAEKKNQQTLSLFEQHSASDFLDFPWETCQLFQPPSVENLLEFPLSTWDQLRPELEKDLRKLSQSSYLREPFQVMSYQWDITLYDGDRESVSISFKYPISLIEEAKRDFPLSLAQLEFGFVQLQNELKEKSKDTDFLNVQHILGWTLKVTDIIESQALTGSLFPDESQQAQSVEELVHLQNTLKSPVQTYSVKNIHVPGLDFINKDLEDVEESIDETSKVASVHLQRPLFIYPQPITIKEDELGVKKFLERTSSDWWISQNQDDSFRDYYICELKSGDIAWVYRDTQGGWFKHGLYS